MEHVIVRYFKNFNILGFYFLVEEHKGKSLRWYLTTIAESDLDQVIQSYNLLKNKGN